MGSRGEVMETWKKTEIKWPMWDYHVSGNPEPLDGKPTTIQTGNPDIRYDCVSIVAESLMHRRFSIAASLLEVASDGGKRGLSIHGIQSVRAAVFKFFSENELLTVSDSPYSGAILTFRLSWRESFCEKAIDVVGRIFECFGIQDDKGCLRGNFTIIQKTLVLVEGKWIPYEDMLRKKFNLQKPGIYCWTN